MPPKGWGQMSASSGRGVHIRATGAGACGPSWGVGNGATSDAFPSLDASKIDKRTEPSQRVAPSFTTSPTRNGLGRTNRGDSNPRAHGGWRDGSSKTLAPAQAPKLSSTGWREGSHETGAGPIVESNMMNAGAVDFLCEAVNGCDIGSHDSGASSDHSSDIDRADVEAVLSACDGDVEAALNLLMEMTGPYADHGNAGSDGGRDAGGDGDEGRISSDSKEAVVIAGATLRATAAEFTPGQSTVLALDETLKLSENKPNPHQKHSPKSSPKHSPRSGGGGGVGGGKARRHAAPRVKDAGHSPYTNDAVEWVAPEVASKLSGTRKSKKATNADDGRSATAAGIHSNAGNTWNDGNDNAGAGAVTGVSPTPSSRDDLYHIERRDAIAASRQRDKLVRSAARCFAQKDHNGVRVALAKAQEMRVTAQRLHQQAAVRIFNARNNNGPAGDSSNSSDSVSVSANVNKHVEKCNEFPWVIDMHGLHANECVDMLLRHIETLHSSSKAGSIGGAAAGPTHSGSNRTLGVIVGVGSHSTARHVLGPAVEACLIEHKFAYTQPRSGYFSVKLPL